VHHDGQGSAWGVTDAAGARVEQTIYRPYGNWASDLTAQFDSTTPTESYSYFGERLDADAGLLFLNARYFDPDLAMFLQPDWWEVTETGVGTNRYAYAGGDPVNGVDPGGARDKLGGRRLVLVYFRRHLFR
jgi:RHS repeat-associated protein